MNGVQDPSNGGVEVQANHVISDHLVSNGPVGDKSLSEDDTNEESEELERELDVLMADRAYHDFVQHVVEHKDIADDEHDPEYKDTEDVAETPEEVEAAGDDEVDSETSTLTDFDEDEDAADAEDAADQELKVPMSALLQAEQRFPPFWRLKHALKNMEMTDYVSEEDPDYKPENDLEVYDNSQTEDSQDDEVVEEAAAPEWREVEQNLEESSGDEVEEVMKTELEDLHVEKSKDLQDDMDGLVEMVQEMTLPPSADTYENKDAVYEEDMEQEVSQQRLAESIMNFDNEGYVSGEDPDFHPDPQALEQASQSEADGSSSSSEAEME